MHFLESLDILQDQNIPYAFIRIGTDVVADNMIDIEYNVNSTDDTPPEIETFKPVININDDEWGRLRARINI